MKRGILIGLALAAVVAWLTGGPEYLARTALEARAGVVAQIRRGELAAAYPSILTYQGYERARAGVASANAGMMTPPVSTTTAGRGKAAPHKPARASAPASTIARVASWSEWRARPLGTRWALYASAGWRPVRLLTRGYLGMLLAVSLVAMARAGVLPALPLLRSPYYLLMWAWHLRSLRPGTSHGSASWAGGDALKALRPRRGEVPFVIGKADGRTVALPERAQYEHVLLVAPPGGGKTTSQIIPNLLREPGRRSVLVSDPKRELIRTTAPALRERGHDVWIADFMDPEVGRAYNPLAYIRDVYGAELFAQAWVKNTGTSDKEPFWDQMAEMLIAAVTLHLVATESHPDTGEPPPLYRLREALAEQGPDDVAAMLEGSPVAGDVRVLLDTMANNERLLGSVFTGLAPRLRSLKMGEIRRTTSRNEIDFRRLAHEPVALYLGFDFQDKELLAPLSGSFFLHFFLTLQREAKANRGKLPVPVLAYLDEFGNLGRIPSFENHITLVRSSRLGCLLVLQSVEQLRAAYGEEAATIIKGSCSTKMALGRLTGKDAQYFVELAGKATVVSTNKNLSRQTQSPFVSSGNTSQSETARDLITADELRTMDGRALLVTGSLRPLLVEQQPFYEDRRLSRRVPDIDRYDALEEMSREKLGLPPLHLEAAPDAGDGGGQPGDGDEPVACEPPAVIKPTGGPLSGGGAVAPPPYPSQGSPGGGAREDVIIPDWRNGGNASDGSSSKPTPPAVDRTASGAPAPTGTDGPADVERVGRKSGGPGTRAAGAGPELTADDRRLLGELHRGLSEKKIAMRLGVPAERVREHVGALCERLGAPDGEALVLVARSHGLMAREAGEREV